MIKKRRGLYTSNVNSAQARVKWRGCFPPWGQSVDKMLIRLSGQVREYPLLGCVFKNWLQKPLIGPWNGSQFCLRCPTTMFHYPFHFCSWNQEFMRLQGKADRDRCVCLNHSRSSALLISAKNVTVTRAFFFSCDFMAVVIHRRPKTPRPSKRQDLEGCQSSPPPFRKLRKN